MASAGRFTGIFVAVALAGCVGSFSTLYQLGTDLSPNEAERRIELAFQSHQIPLLEKNPDGRVRSGRFDPDEVWGGTAEEKMVCGEPEENEERGRIEPTELEVLVTIHARGTAGTQLSIESYGKGRRANGEEVPCRLEPELSVAILASARASRR
jgi:hypothetical protein